MEFTEECASILRETNKSVIEHDVKLKQVCKTLNNMDKKLDKLNEKMDDNIKTFINRKMFLSINGIIIGILLLLGGYIYTLNDKINDVNIQVVENKVCIENLK